jgi:ABC-type dipeptide/oligopeptide/nickel transport system ATPase component
MLDIKNLTITVEDEGAVKKIVDDVSLSVPPHTITALVGGSGSGKTTTGLAILKLLSPALKIERGEILFDNQDILKLPENSLRELRGKKISMVFQEPLNAFNPLFTIGYQIEEVLIYHTQLPPGERKKKVLELLDIVGIPDPARILNSYPHQLSGGLRQRAMIAQAIAGEPALIIADEPTSNLDVTLQAHILQLFRELRRKLQLSILLITHDLGVVTHLADEVTVLSQGKVVESGKTKDITTRPKHSYTQQLMDTLKD